MPIFAYLNGSRRVANLAVAVASAVLIGCDGSIRPKIEPSSEIELQVLGAKPYPDATFGLGYAFAQGFTRVDLNGSTYRQLSRDLVFRSKQSPPLPPYVAVMDQRGATWVPSPLRFLFASQSLRLLDRPSGNVLATFNLPREGWPGEQAGKWLASLLNPDPNGKQAQQFDISAFASVEAISPSSVAQPDDINARGVPVQGCPKDIFAHYEQNPDHGQGELRAPKWTLLMPAGLAEVHCTHQAILLFRGYRENLEVIAIDSEGTLIGRGFVRNEKISLGYQQYFNKIVALEKTDEQLVVRRAHFLPQSLYRQGAVATYEVKFSIPWSALAMPR